MPCIPASPTRREILQLREIETAMGRTLDVAGVIDFVMVARRHAATGQRRKSAERPSEEHYQGFMVRGDQDLGTASGVRQESISLIRADRTSIWNGLVIIAMFSPRKPLRTAAPSA